MKLLAEKKAGRSQPQGGFTLIELMVVVVIIAILGAIAIPAYQNYVLRGKIPDATSTLANQRIVMEQFFQDHVTYLGAPLCASPSTPSPSGSFSMSCSNVTATTYTLQATGVGGMTGFSYSIDEHNAKSSTIVSPAPSNWVSSAQPCWITKAGGQC